MTWASVPPRPSSPRRRPQRGRPAAPWGLTARRRAAWFRVDPQAPDAPCPPEIPGRPAGQLEGGEGVVPDGDQLPVAGGDDRKLPALHFLRPGLLGFTGLGHAAWKSFSPACRSPRSASQSLRVRAGHVRRRPGLPAWGHLWRLAGAVIFGGPRPAQPLHLGANRLQVCGGEPAGSVTIDTVCFWVGAGLPPLRALPPRPRRQVPAAAYIALRLQNLILGQAVRRLASGNLPGNPLARGRGRA
jgi:hypothetical protein